jgi:hypothetical protein
VDDVLTQSGGRRQTGLCLAPLKTVSLNSTLEKGIPMLQKPYRREATPVALTSGSRPYLNQFHPIKASFDGVDERGIVRQVGL